MNLIFGVVAIILLTLIIISISQFNTLKRLRNQIENASSSLDALFIKRNDLIPMLVSVVKGYVNHESNILEKITKLRQPLRGASDYVNGGETDILLKQLMIQVESYPDLKANQQFNNLQYSINECEDHIAAGRRYLNTSITQYNNAVTTFPGNIFSHLFDMKALEWIRATDSQRENADISGLSDK